MTESVAIWSVDRLAATQLLAGLKVPDSSEVTDHVAELFARHRECAQAWAAARVQASSIRKLEAVSVELFDRKSEEWADGFRAAEAQLVAASPHDLLGTSAGKAQTAGQILRRLVSGAKQAGLAAEG